MSWVSDILELCKKFGFVEVVYEYEHALKFRLGKVVEKRKKLNQEDLEKIVAEEKEAIKKEGGKLQYIIPFCNPRIPKAYKRSFLNGMPIHPKRFEVKNISLKDKLKPNEVDLFFFGGGQDQSQQLVSEDLVKSKGKVIKEEVERGVPLLSICGGYQLLGEYYRGQNGLKLPIILSGPASV